MIVTKTITNNITSIFSATGGEFAVTVMFFCNTSDTIDTSLTLYFNNAVEGSMFIKDLPLKAGETFVFDSEKLILKEGDSIIGSISTTEPLPIVSASLSLIQTS